LNSFQLVAEQSACITSVLWAGSGHHMNRMIDFGPING
jgi:hypothetical protein